MIPKKLSKFWKVGLLWVALLTGTLFVPIPETSAGFSTLWSSLYVLPLDIALVDGTQIAADHAAGVAWPTITGIVNEANDIWIQAGIQFSLDEVVTIADPDPPPSGPGALGDILFMDYGWDEYNDAVASAQAALASDSITAIKFRHFVNPYGVITSYLGCAFDIPAPCTSTTLAEMSKEPVLLTVPNHLAGLVPPDPNQVITDARYAGRVSGATIWHPGAIDSHEIGHLLGLYHPWDEAPSRTVLSPPCVSALPAGVYTPNDELMAQTWGRKDCYLNPTQIATVRNYAANHVPGMRQRIIFYGPIQRWRRLSRFRARDIICELPPDKKHLDLSEFGAWTDLDTSNTTFTAITAGLLPHDITGVSYTFRINLDAEDKTGVPFKWLEGVDVIAKILVNATKGFRAVSYELTLFDKEKTPIKIVDPSVVAKTRTLKMALDSENSTEIDIMPSGEMVSISIPDSILAKFVPIAEDYPMTATSSWGDLTDQAPVLKVSRAIPHPPELIAEPLTGPPGTISTLKGTYLTANAPIWIMFDDTKVGNASTDETGEFQTSITIPANASRGDHSLWAFSPTKNANGDTLVYRVTAPVGGIVIPTDSSTASANLSESLLFLCVMVIAITTVAVTAKKRKLKHR